MQPPRQPPSGCDLKRGAADLPATARRIGDDAERRRILGRVIDELVQGGRRMPAGEVEAWMVGNPLFAVASNDPQPT